MENDNYSDSAPTDAATEAAPATPAVPGDPDRADALRARGFHPCDPAEAPANG